MKKNLKNKKSLSIAMLGHKRIPSREGGIEIVVEELATRMVTLGHKVTCYNRSGHHVSGKDFDGGKRKAYKGVRLKSVLTLDKKGLAAMTASVSGAICAAFGKYDVVHFHAEGPCAMLWLPKLFGKRCIATVHGLDHQRAKWGKLASTYIMMGEKCAVKFADEIIVLSKGVQDYFKETYGRETKFIPNGVNASLYWGINQMKNHFPGDTCILLLDEPDRCFHPEWSRRFIKNLTETLTSSPFNKFNYQIIIATHTYTPSLFVKNFILPKEREEGIAVEN